MAQAWSRAEVEAIVADYFAMYARELRGERYSKAQHRRALLPLLSNRSEGSVERKHQNISAILIDLGFPCIPGYKPLRHYQMLLFRVAQERLAEREDLRRLVARVVDAPPPPGPIEVGDILRAKVAAPAGLGGASLVQEPTPPPAAARAPKVDYLLREARNAALGEAGERFVVAFEKARLEASGRPRLAAAVEQVSRTQGDGLGFDVLSFEESGAERWIEVKTTRWAREIPFYVSGNEVRVSAEHAERYALYRVFQFRRSPRLYEVRGSIGAAFDLSPSEFRARLP